VECPALKCGEARAFLSQINDKLPNVSQIADADLDYLSANDYVLQTTKEEHDRAAEEVTRLSQLVSQVRDEKTNLDQKDSSLERDKQTEHSFQFHFESKDVKGALQKRIQEESVEVSKEEAELGAMEANVDALIREKSTIDRMVAYGGAYTSLTDLGTVILNDLGVRNYRVADEEFSDFLTEIRATYAELRTIADKASWYANIIQPSIPGIETLEHPLKGLDPDDMGEMQHALHEAQSISWGTAIGLGKLQGDPNVLGERFVQSLYSLRGLDSTFPNRLMAAEIMTALVAQDVKALESTLKDLERQLRKQGVPKELSGGVACTIMAGRRHDGTFPLDRFAQFRQQTSSFEAASILAVMNVAYEDLMPKFQGFRSLFSSWGYMRSEDTEIASAFLAIGELGVEEVQEKLKYIVDQLKNYLGYPLVAGAILASIPVFEAHEVIDLMEKAVTLLCSYTSGLERSELVALAVRMIHGVRNELVREIDSTAKLAETPVQFTYSPHPGLFIWYRPVIVAHASYHATFSGIGGFHPAHSHGVGGFAG
jgi:hypothetical protein